jgi:glycosyltransferase involved in cell wall biosynthesis
VLSIQGSPTVFRRLYLRGVDRHYLRSLSFVEFLKGRGPVHDHMKMKAQAAMEAVTMASVDHIAGRTEWDHRLASVMAPQAVYHRCEEPMRLPFYQASWHAEAAIPGRIVSISGDYLRKGVGTLLRAFDLLRRAEPGTTLVLAGVFPDTRHERATMRHVRALGIEDRVTVMGEIDAQTVAGELTQASVFVSPSHGENGCNTLSEAQLVGVPCIASSAGGMVTTADHGSGALLVQDGDVEELAGALLSLVNDPDRAARLGERGRALASARHDRERIRAQILSMYDDMLA